MERIAKLIVVLVVFAFVVAWAVQSKSGQGSIHPDFDGHAGRMSRGMALLNWFPRVKAKLMRSYGAQQLAGTSIRSMERIFEASKEADRLSPRDFLDFSGAYTDGRVEDAVEALYDRLAESQEDVVVKSAIIRQIEDAERVAYAYLEALENPQGPGYSFYTGGF